MQNIKRHRDRTDPDQGGDDTPWQEIEARDRKPERDTPKSDARQNQPVKVEAFGIDALDGIDELHRHEDADEPDGNIDQEDPVPGEIGSDEAAERRADAGANHTQ